MTLPVQTPLRALSTSVHSGSGENVGSKISTPSPSHPCRLCGRIYERADHLNRHLKSHENARPHKCTRCPKSFNRVDLLNRHQAGHDRQGSDSISIERGDRVAAACSACVSAKAKCQDQKPCTRCQRRGIACELPAGSNNSISVGQLLLGIATDTATSANQDSHAKDNHAGENLLGEAQFIENQGREVSLENGHERGHRQVSIEQAPIDEPAQYATDTCVNQIDRASRGIHAPQHDFIDSSRAESSNESTIYNNQPLPSSLTTAYLEHPVFSYLPTNSQNALDMHVVPLDSYLSQDLDFGMWDIDLDSVELSFPGFDDMNVQEVNPTTSVNGSESRRVDVSKRYAAFERSPWLWTPTQSDQTLNDQHHLNLDEDNIPAVLTPASPPVPKSDLLASCCIGHRQRDQMLSLLLTMRKAPKPTPRFPSLNLLNSIIQVYFVQENFRFDSLVHTGTFTPSKTLPQLLISMVSAGSTLISVPAIWKMGLALAEVVRHTVADYWEEDNRNTRNLQALQAFMIGLDIGLWSGFRRNMEIAESFGQPIVIMLRRAGVFAASRNEPILIPTYDDSPEALEGKWVKWAEKESFKRLVLRIFIHDTHASIGLQKPPLISFTELKFSLPASRSLWSAGSATEWRNIYLSTQGEPSNVPSCIEAMQLPENLQRLSSCVDVRLASMAILHGYWGQIWYLLESKKFFPISKSTQRLAIHASSTELYRDISSFSKHLPSLTRNCSEAYLLSELLMMILHVSLDDLQRFAGKYGEEEAQKASQGFADWAKTSDARVAVWHAGQVFCASKLLLPAKNRGFNAIATYYASLTLWVYGLMTLDPSLEKLSPLNRSLHTSGHKEDQVVLNGPESLQTQVFQTTSQGLPGITITNNDEVEEFVALRNADRVLTAARDIYKRNYPGTNDALPPLVENLGNLLRDLGSLSSGGPSRVRSESPHHMQNMFNL